MRPRLTPSLLCALALAGCGADPSTTALGPAPLVPGSAGPEWRVLAPTLAGPADACRPDPARCMDTVVGEMSRRLSALARRCDHRAPFLLMYRQVSREVGRSVRTVAYRDPAYVARLDAVFATLYFHAADSWRLGRRNEVPRAWRMAFSAAGGRTVSALGDMLLGMNAHISRDLPYAIAAVGLRLPDGSDATPDVVAVNDDIGRSQEPMLRAIKRRFDNTVSSAPRLSRWLDADEVAPIIAAWRREALENARDLLSAPDDAARHAVETRIDTNAALRSLLIWRETAYRDKRAAMVRSAYCAMRQH